MTEITAKADEYSCFGWVQPQPTTTSIVGELRCNKRVGPIILNWIEKALWVEEDKVAHVTVERVSTKVYEDTKIKLHFSHFKTLDAERVTCFRDPPHCCEGCKDSYVEGGADGEGNVFVRHTHHNTGDEL